MKHIPCKTIYPNVKCNHTKKYQHKMKIITFLKSNYKYKRRCTIRSRCRRWHCQQQTLPLPVAEKKMPNHRITKKLFLFATEEVSKFPRILILIIQSTTTAVATATILPSFPVVTFDDSGFSAKPFVMEIQRRIVITNRALTAAVHANDEIRHQCNAYKDANEDTNIGSKATNHNARHRRYANNEIYYQYCSNYDKVSTITSTPPLRCYRTKRHQQHQLHQATTSATKYSLSSISLLSNLSSLLSTPSSPSSDQGNSDESNRCVSTTTILRHFCHDYQLENLSMHTKLTGSVRFKEVDDFVNVNSSGIDKKSVKSTEHSKSCHSMQQYVDAATNSSSNNNNHFGAIHFLLTLFIAFAIGVRSAAAGACWQTVLGNGKCNEIFSFNVSKSDCCGANQEFAYTDREPTSVEYFFATAIGGGMECTPCLESCRNVKCGPNKKCVKRKGRPKCVCAPECGAARRRRLQREQQLQQQHHSLFSANVGGSSGIVTTMVNPQIMRREERSRQARDTHSLSSEITNANLGSGKQNQRKFIHIHMQHDYTHQQEAPPPTPPRRKNQQPKGNRRLLITANVEHTEKPTTRRIQLFSNVRTTYARHGNKNNNNANGQHGDSDLSEEYEEEDDYDEEDGGGDRSRDIIFNSGFSNNNNHNDEDQGSVDDEDDTDADDATTRFRNQSLSRQKSKTNKNYHDLQQTTKAQQRDQYSSHNNNNNSHIRRPHPNGQHAENTPKYHHHRHRNNNSNNRHQHKHKQQQKHRHYDDRHGEHFHHEHHHQHQNNHHNNRQQNSGSGRRKHNRQHNKDYNKDYSNINTTTTTATTGITNIVVPPSTDKTSISGASSVTTTPQLQSIPTTPVNSTLSAASDQNHITNHGSKIATSSSLPLPTSPSSSSSKSLSSSSGSVAAAAAPNQPNMQTTLVTMPAAAASTSSLSSPSSAFSYMDNVKGDGKGVEEYPYYDRGGKFKTSQHMTTATKPNSFGDDSENTISTSHNFDSVSFDSYVNQFDMHGFPKNHHAITIRCIGCVYCKKKTMWYGKPEPPCGTESRSYRVGQKAETGREAETRNFRVGRETEVSVSDRKLKLPCGTESRNFRVGQKAEFSVLNGKPKSPSGNSKPKFSVCNIVMEQPEWVVSSKKHQNHLGG
ncbi:follistatin isoform X2 [Musca autumnalis]|uniref:follistatin isoform X2 n=1 Tax=Musca autumnalis TaxID=221902 RepID=UPI003CF49359